MSLDVPTVHQGATIQVFSTNGGTLAHLLGYSHSWSLCLVVSESSLGTQMSCPISSACVCFSFTAITILAGGRGDSEGSLNLVSGSNLFAGVCSLISFIQSIMWMRGAAQVDLISRCHSIPAPCLYGESCLSLTTMYASHFRRSWMCLSAVVSTLPGPCWATHCSSSQILILPIIHNTSRLMAHLLCTIVTTSPCVAAPRKGR